jgi:hypothetical protein
VLLLGCLLLVQIRAHGHRRVRIDGTIPFLDVLDHAIFVDDDIGPLRPLIGFVLDVVAFEDAVFLQHLLVHIAQQGELDVDLLREGGVRGGTIHAHAKNFGVGGVDLTCGYSRLDRLELFGSTTGEGKNVNREQHVLLTAVVAEFDRFPLIAKKGEVRGNVADLERDLGHFRLLSLRRR